MASTFNARDAAVYERSMGRWSRRLAPGLVAFAGLPGRGRVLDVGCGTGSLLFELAADAGFSQVCGIDASAIYAEAAQAKATDPRIEVRHGDACAMPYADGRFDAALSQLVLQFVPDPGAALGEMRRVVRPGGVVAAAVWNSGGGMPHQRMFWDTAALLDPAAAKERGRTFNRPMTRRGDLEALFRSHGLQQVEESSLTIWMDFDDFADYWGRSRGARARWASMCPPCRRRRRRSCRGTCARPMRPGRRTVRATSPAPPPSAAGWCQPMEGRSMLLIDNQVVAQVLTMPDCIAAQEKAFAGLIDGASLTRPRIDVYAPCDRPDGYYRWGSTEGVSDGVLAVRLKSDVITWPTAADGSRTEQKYCVSPGTYCGLVLLFSTANGEPLAMMNDGHLQHMRVGGAAGIGTKLLARADAETVGMIGSGGMAHTFLEAIAAVRRIKRVRVYSRSAANRERYAHEMAAAMGIEVVPVDTPEAAVRGADIVATCTDSMGPVLEPGWIEPGMHVVTLGPREISAEVAARFDVRVRQGNETLDLPESRQFRKGIAGGGGAYVAGTAEEQKRLPAKHGAIGLKVDDWPVYTDIISGAAPGRTSDAQSTLYRTIGNWGVQFSSVGAHVFRTAKAQGLGRELPQEWFLQDIRN